MLEAAITIAVLVWVVGFVLVDSLIRWWKGRDTK